MVSLTTQGIEIMVETFYQPEYSHPVQHEFMFAYRITLENHNVFAVQLLNRHWQIFDSIGEVKNVDGEGVVGRQPTMGPGEIFQYVSGCNLKTEIGRMHGTYDMVNLHNLQHFAVEIPAFDLIAPMKFN